MGEWEKTSFSEVFEIVKGISYKSSDYGDKDSGVPFINLKCIAKDGGFSQRGIKYYKGAVPENSRLSEGDLIIANTDLTRAGDVIGCPLLVPNIPSEVVTMSMDVSRLDFFNSKYSPEYFYYILMSAPVRKYMRDNSRGSTVLHLQTSQVPKYELKVPPLKEQQKIAQILTKADEAIQHTERLIAKYQAIRTGLMQDLLTRGIDEAGNVRSEETHAFKDSELGRIPVEWEIRALKSLAQIIDPQPDHRTPPADPDGFPYVGIGDINENGRIDTNCRRIIRSALIKQQSNFTIDKGDIIFGKIGTIGKPQAINQTKDISLSANVILIKPNQNKQLILEILKSDFIRRQIENTIHTTTQPAFGMGKTRALLFAWPSMSKERDQIELVVTQNWRSLQEANIQLKKLKNLKTALMQDLLTGKKRVDDLLK